MVEEWKFGCNLNTMQVLLVLFCVFVHTVLYIDDQSFQGQVVLCNQSSFVKFGRLAYNRGCLLGLNQDKNVLCHRKEQRGIY